VGEACLTHVAGNSFLTRLGFILPCTLIIGKRGKVETLIFVLYVKIIRLLVVALKKPSYFAPVICKIYILVTGIAIV